MERTSRVLSACKGRWDGESGSRGSDSDVGGGSAWDGVAACRRRWLFATSMGSDTAWQAKWTMFARGSSDSTEAGVGDELRTIVA